MRAVRKSPQTGEQGNRERTSLSALASSPLLLVATALTPARAADMTAERALNPQREPQNWILHHGNYQGHRFSALNEINADTSSCKPVFTVALSGFQSGGRAMVRRSRRRPRRGRRHVRAGRLGSVYAIDPRRKEGSISGRCTGTTAPGPATSPAAASNRGVGLWKDKPISISLDGRMFAINKATGDVFLWIYHWCEIRRN